MVCHVTDSGDTMLVGFYRRNGVVCAAIEETKQQTGLIIQHEAVVGTDIFEVLLKLHARFGMAVENVDPEDLFCEETQ